MGMRIMKRGIICFAAAVSIVNAAETVSADGVLSPEAEMNISDTAKSSEEDRISKRMKISYSSEAEWKNVARLYMNGYEDGTIRPDGCLTRAEAAAMVARLQKHEKNISRYGKNLYSDVENGWYDKYISYVSRKGIMQGYPDGSFKPDSNITRAELAQLIWNLDTRNENRAPFSDIEGHWAEQTVHSLFGTGRVEGYPDGTFRPDRPISRAEAARVLNKYFDRGIDPENFEITENIKTFSDLSKEHWGYYELIEASHSHKYERDENGTRFSKWIEVIPDYEE